MRSHLQDIADVRAVVQLYIDGASVARIDGRWWITNKTYAHTGGSMPAR